MLRTLIEAGPAVLTLMTGRCLAMAIATDYTGKRQESADLNCELLLGGALPRF